MLKIHHGNAGGPSRIQTGVPRMKPVYGVLLSAISSPSCKAFRMLFDPLKGVKGLFDLVGGGNALKDMILKEMVGGIVGFL